ncbi:Hypothetical predicted protein [Mytilus galloprovincialis]|uniref:Endonuclease/exonuclease/phosphatase domain-containing protein n=1 Tax=Mytilus galloprovincialis TaxID=29158 RepID=A0A8B6D2G4_MYTGA|nr:Hypothetical predicted protein [Mytilus galloprovincialis]
MENEQYYSSISAEKTLHLQNTTLRKNRSLNNNRKESIKATKYENNENKTTKCLEETYFGLKKNGLKISHLNIRGVLSKFDEMKLFINQKNNTHIMGICETFLTSNTEDSFISIKGFELERKDRCETSEKKGGGVVAYVSSSLKYKRRTDLEISSLESIWLQIHFKNSKSLLICFIYRPPDMPQSWIDEFEKEIEKANELELEMIIMGDINIDFTGGA